MNKIWVLGSREGETGGWTIYQGGIEPRDVLVFEDNTLEIVDIGTSSRSKFPFELFDDRIELLDPEYTDRVITYRILHLSETRMTLSYMEVVYEYVGETLGNNYSEGETGKQLRRTTDLLVNKAWIKSVPSSDESKESEWEEPEFTNMMILLDKLFPVMLPEFQYKLALSLQVDRVFGVEVHLGENAAVGWKLFAIKDKTILHRLLIYGPDRQDIDQRENCFVQQIDEYTIRLVGKTMETYELSR